WFLYLYPEAGPPVHQCAYRRRPDKALLRFAFPGSTTNNTVPKRSVPQWMDIIHPTLLEVTDIYGNQGMLRVDYREAGELREDGYKENLDVMRFPEGPGPYLGKSLKDDGDKVYNIGA